MKRLRLAVGVILGAIVFLGLVGTASATIYTGGTRALCYEDVHASGALWKGARVQMELRTGSVDSSDIGNGGYIEQELQLIDTRTSDGYWVRAGVVRNDATGSPDTIFFWDNADTSGYHRHNIMPSGGLDPELYIGTADEKQWVEIVNTQSTNQWTIKIAGYYASDNGNYTANMPFSIADEYFVGLRSNCSTGKYGTQSNPSNCVSLQRTLDNGATWGYPGSQYATAPPAVDPANMSHHGWTTPVQSSWHYRNTQ